MTSDDLHLILEKLNAIEARQSSIETGIVNLGTRLIALESTVEARLQDTRPLWEALQHQIIEFRAENDKNFRRLEKRLDVLSVEMNKLRAEMGDLEDRMGILEGRMTSLEQKPA